MNRLSVKKRVQVIGCLVEGNSVRSTSRLTGVAKGTILKLLVDMGYVCQRYHDEHVRRLTCKRIQADEIWAFVGAKRRTLEHREIKGAGDAWTWTALDPDSKLLVSYLVGQRNEEYAIRFLRDLNQRLSGRFQLSTDGNFQYVDSVKKVFKGWIDFGIVMKMYKANRYVGSEKRRISGDPNPQYVSTSLVERQNLDMRMRMRRFTRKTNAFSKKMTNLEAAVALNFMHYNFCRVHSKLRVTPAVEAGIADHVWSLEELVGLLDQRSILHGLVV